VLCPRCSYDLTGLPDVHTCPECGFEYDPLARSIVLRGRRVYAFNLIWSVAFALTYFYFWYPRMDFASGKAIVIAFLGVALVTTLYRVWKRENLPQLLLMNRHGLAFHPPTVASTVVPWSDITRAKCSWVTGALCVIGRDGQTLLRCSYRTLGTLRIAKRCAQEINALVGRYSDRATH
jgi:hypothetical protein